MAVAFLSWINHVDASGAILIASNQAGDLSISNVASPIIGRRWRSTSLTAFADMDFGSDKPVGFLALVFPRDTAFPTAGTIRHQLDADGGTIGSGAVYDSTAVAIGTVNGYGYHIHILPAAVNARHWRATFNVSGVSFVDVGRMWAGEVFQPTRNISFGYGDEWGDLSRITTADRSGSDYVDARSRQRVLAFSFDSLEIAERESIREMQRIAGLSNQIVFVKDPGAPGKETIIGRMAQSTPIRHREISIFSKAFVIRESL